MTTTPTTEPRTPAETSVAVQDLTVRYRRKTALDGVRLDFGNGVHGLLGPNGAGKTSLIRVLATVSTPTSGEVRLLDRRVTARGSEGHRARTEARRQLGYLPQQFGYYPGFTVREFVSYVAWLKEIPGHLAAAAVERAVARVGLTDRIDTKVRTLSGGMIRRIGIAQAIVNEPRLLLLDEPTAGLDPEQRVDFRELLRDLGREATVLVSTHLVEDVAAACSQVTLVDGGRVAYRGAPRDLAQIGEVAVRENSAGGAEAISGDNAIERGYTSVLRAHRSGAEADR